VSPVGTGGGRRRRVLMFPLPFQGHLTPILQLAGTLHAAGVPSADLLSSGSDADFAGTLLWINDRLWEPFRDRLRQAFAEEKEGGGAVACLVVDSNLRGMQLAAEELGKGAGSCSRPVAPRPGLRCAPAASRCKGSTPKQAGMCWQSDHGENLNINHHRQSSSSSRSVCSSFGRVPLFVEIHRPLFDPIKFLALSSFSHSHEPIRSNPNPCHPLSPTSIEFSSPPSVVVPYR
jgi:hypothetical protein